MKIRESKVCCRNYLIFNRRLEWLLTPGIILTSEILDICKVSSRNFIQRRCHMINLSIKLFFDYSNFVICVSINLCETFFFSYDMFSVHPFSYSFQTYFIARLRFEFDLYFYLYSFFVRLICWLWRGLELESKRRRLIHAFLMRITC